jgi:hypothetical protein
MFVSYFDAKRRAWRHAAEAVADHRRQVDPWPAKHIGGLQGEAGSRAPKARCQAEGGR